MTSSTPPFFEWLALQAPARRQACAVVLVEALRTGLPEEYGLLTRALWGDEAARDELGRQRLERGV